MEKVGTEILPPKTERNLKMKEKENQILRKEHHPRSSDLANRRSKDSVAKKTSKKIAKKSLAEAFASPTKDALLDISEESIIFSPISFSNVEDETAESFVMAPYPSTSASPETCTSSGLNSCSKISTANGDEQIDFSNTRSAEVEIVVNFLKQPRQETLNSVHMEKKSQKVLDALIEFIIKEFYTLPEKKDKLPQLIPGNVFAGYLCFLLWIVPILLFSFYFFYNSTVAHSYPGLPPT